MTFIVHRSRAVRWAAMIVLLTTVASGCGSKSESSPNETPDTVALAYTNAIYSGRFQAAVSYVEPADQGIVRALMLGLSKGSVRASHIAVGSRSVMGGHALVVLTGTLCTTASRQSLGHAKQECITNSNPRSTNPAFRVTLTRTGDRWYVTYTRSPTSRTPQGMSPNEATGGTTVPAG